MISYCHIIQYDTIGLHSLLLRSWRCNKSRVGWDFAPDTTGNLLFPTWKFSFAMWSFVKILWWLIINVSCVCWCKSTILYQQVFWRVFFGTLYSFYSFRNSHWQLCIIVTMLIVCFVCFECTCSQQTTYVVVFLYALLCVGNF